MAKPDSEFFAKLNRNWQAWSFPQKATSLILVAFCMACLGWYFVDRKVDWCPLLEGRSLRSEELAKIQLALGKAGLNDFRIEQQLILVPHRLRDKYLKAIPEELIDAAVPNNDLSIFATRGQIDLFERHKKQLLISKLIRDLPYIEDANVVLDSAIPPRSSTPQFSCFIGVTPRRGMLLEADQILTLRSMATGAIAGLRSDNIVIADYSTGRILDPTASPNKPGQTKATAYSKPPDRQILQQAIFDRLAQYPGVTVEIIQKPEKPGIVNRQLNRSSELNGNYANRPDILPGSNSRESVAPEDHDLRSFPETAPSILSIQITVPYSSLQKTMTGGRELSGLEMESLRTEIQAAAMKGLPLGADPTLFEFDIVLPMRATAGLQPIQSAGPSWKYLQGRYSGVALAVISGGLLCLILGLSSRRKTATSDPADEPIDNEPSSPQAVRTKIDSLIQKDPAIVAEVLQDWIRRAG